MGGVELPGVEPGSRGPAALGSTCVGSGSSRERCSGARQPPFPYHHKVFPSARWSRPSGWSLVMSIRPSYEASEADRREFIKPRERQVRCHLLVPAFFIEVTRAPSARSHGNGSTTVETVSAPGCGASTLCSCQGADPATDRVDHTGRRICRVGRFARPGRFPLSDHLVVIPCRTTQRTGSWPHARVAIRRIRRSSYRPRRHPR